MTTPADAATGAAVSAARRRHRGVGIGLTALGVVLMVLAATPLDTGRILRRPSASAPATWADPISSDAVAAAVPGPEIGSPRAIHIPTIGVMVDGLVPLARRPNGTLAAPDDYSRVGWYADGPEPGEPGAAVIAGHVDSTTGPATFYRLRELQPGQPIIINTAGGASLTFLVERTERHPKQQFPTAVYATTQPALRLITCAGTFDRHNRSYRDNLVVYARLAPP